MRWSIADFRGPILLASLVCASCSREAPAPEPDGVVARIGDRVITADDLRLKAQTHPAMTKEELLHALLAHEAQSLRAQPLADDPAVRREIDRLLVNRLRERELAGRLKAAEVPDAEIQAEYDRRRAEFTRPAMDRFAMLFLQIEKNASETKQAEVHARMASARQLARQQAEKDFGKLSLDYSDDQLGRYRGGDLGWIAANKTSNRLPETVLETGRRLELGTVSEILETDEGLYIVKKTDHRPGATTPLEQVRASLRRRLLAERREQIETDFIETCMQQAAPQIDAAAFARFELETTPQQPELPVPTGGLPMAGN